jgi:hypothetical protein
MSSTRCWWRVAKTTETILDLGCPLADGGFLSPRYTPECFAQPPLRVDALEITSNPVSLSCVMNAQVAIDVPMTVSADCDVSNELVCQFQLAQLSLLEHIASNLDVQT